MAWSVTKDAFVSDLLAASILPILPAPFSIAHFQKASGLSIDHDEISGKGKTMFMITAIGTAVKLNTVVENKQNENFHNDSAEAHVIESKIKEIQLLNEIEKGKDGKMDEEDWNMASKLNLSQTIPTILKFMSEYKSTNFYNAEKFVKKATEFICSLDQESVYKYRKEFYESGLPQGLFLKFVTVHLLVDYDYIIEILKSGNRTLRREALYTLSSYKLNYNKDDIEKISDIIALIEDKKQDLVETVKKKSMFSSNDTQSWLCPLGHKNDFEQEICKNSTCEYDKYGMPKNKYIANIKDDLEELLNALKQVFHK